MIRQHHVGSHMKPEQIYQELCDFAEKLGIEVSEQNFRATGIPVSSGLCLVRGKRIFMMDKHKSIHKKMKLLARELAKLPHDDYYLVPAVRDVLLKYGPDPSGEGVFSEQPPPGLGAADAES